MTTYRIPGVEVAVAKDSKIIYSKGFGKTSEGTEVTADTPMYIGSVSKSFTALAVMQLVEKGKINLDSPVIYYLPWFKVKDDTITKNITVRHLLNQTSGLSETTYFPDLPDNLTLEAAVKDLAKAEPIAKPGETFNYFNSNYIVLGLIIEKVSGSSYSEYIKKNITEPLSMNNTLLSREEIEEKLDKGHSSIFGFPVKRKEPFKAYGLAEGYIVSTANDMIKFLLAHSDTQSNFSKTILTKEGFRQLQCPASDIGSDYAMGWQVTRSKNGYAVIHNSGDLNTYHSDVIIIPEKGYRIVLIINQNSYLYSTVVSNSLKNAVANNVLGNSKPQTMPVLIKYLESAGIAVLTIIACQVLSLLCLIKQKQIAKSGNKFRIVVSLMDCLIPIILLFVLPKVASISLNRGVSLREAFNMQPDVTLSFIIISVLCCMKVIVKTVIVFGNSGQIKKLK
ncbi:serine hydrolase domain-containing protein [Anaerotignum sp. MB30-C6]|uniref:serine hydrolase domain-containing protein n=1 Tax=Anaerotignum sp. MB30-C6 TaxID=3070814 RepID=UPI0027DE423E|nr:serine hydrolase domain-containing protein [Anaerotignum sp. MB30-C6]WMI80520.1 serine hydrolase domain-containing protein [Anaerotignum sp. MB30-C6]